MKIGTLKMIGVAALAVATTLAIPGLRAQQKDACGKPMTTEKIAQRALDYAEILNVTSSHEYYHGALLHQMELEKSWSKRDDIAWQNNNDFYKNRKSVWQFYAEGVKSMAPEGDLWYHMLTTPMIEISGDGQTAKSIWMSIGNVTGAMGGKISAQWTEEKYAIDLIKEDGQWKIWHLRTYVEFYSPFEKNWGESNMAAPSTASNALAQGGAPPAGAGAPPASADKGATIKEEPGVNLEMAKPDEKGNYYEGYWPGRKPVLDPLPPTPYCTWKDTKGYVLN